MESKQVVLVVRLDVVVSAQQHAMVVAKTLVMEDVTHVV